MSVAAPTTTVASGSGGSLNPAARRIAVGATHIALCAETADKGSLKFWG